MNERLFQYIWQFRYYNPSCLSLASGELLQVIFPGHANPNQGPDFLNARIRINQTTWAGHVELHLRATDWFRHTHDADLNYQNVILHVVMENDLPGPQDRVPLLVLGDRIPKLMLERCEEWMHSRAFVPCGRNIRQAGMQVWESWIQRLVMERMLRKAEEIHRSLANIQYHWEELFWWRIAANFGIRVNAAAFESVAKSLPTRLLARHKNQLLQVEALLMGQAGLLETAFQDPYPCMLQKEFRFLKKKYNLRPIFHPLYFLRMRPGNFPTIRLSQLAALIHRSSRLFSVIREVPDLDTVRQLLRVNANDYWNRHYRFGEESSFRIKCLGEEMIDNILINTVIPVLFSYGMMQHERQVQDRALAWLLLVPGEKNKVLKQWQLLGIPAPRAFQSQALLELKKHYCEERRCLACSVGRSLLKGIM